MSLSTEARRPKRHMSDPPLPRWLTILAWLSVACAVVMLFGVFPLTGADLEMWFIVGRWTWEHGEPPLVDHFSFTTEGQEFIAHSWLAALIFYFVKERAGTVGVMLLRLTLIGMALLFAVRTAQRLKG